MGFLYIAGIILCAGVAGLFFYKLGQAILIWIADNRPERCGICERPLVFDKEIGWLCQHCSSEVFAQFNKEA